MRPSRPQPFSSAVLTPEMIPYVATVIVLSVIGTKQAGPKANGHPNRKEQR